jgi:hypothetical protein
MVSGFGSVSKDSRSTRRERLRFTVGPRGADAATPVADCRNWPELSRKPGSRRSVCGSITREQPRSRGGLRNGDISDVSHPTSGEKPSAADQRSQRLCPAHKVPGVRDSLNPGPTAACLRCEPGRRLCWSLT